MDRELLIANIARYAAEKNESPSGACVAAGLGKNYVSELKRGKTPSVATVYALAEHLGVMTSDLVGDARQPEEAPELLACWAELNEEGREALLHVATGFVNSGIYKKYDPARLDQKEA